MLGIYSHISVNESGQITAAFRGNPLQFGATDFVALKEPVEFDPSLTYFDGENLVDMGSRPTDRSVFDYSTKQWVEPPITDYEKSLSWINLRIERDRLLATSDWTQVPDAPVDQQAWATYRQELRDLPSKTVDPLNPVWPTPPQ